MKNKERRLKRKEANRRKNGRERNIRRKTVTELRPFPRRQPDS